MVDENAPVSWMHAAALEESGALFAPPLQPPLFSYRCLSKLPVDEVGINASVNRLRVTFGLSPSAMFLLGKHDARHSAAAFVGQREAALQVAAHE